MKKLQDEQITEVNGGFDTKTITIYTYDEGDTFQESNLWAYIVAYTSSETRITAKEYFYNGAKNGWVYEKMTEKDNNYFGTECKYLGKNALNIVDNDDDNNDY